MSKISLSLLFFASIIFADETLYFSCEAKSLTLNEDGSYEEYKYSRGEKIIALSINKESKIVNWDSKRMDFTEDYNKDNIYEFTKNDDIYYLDIRFNGVTGRSTENMSIKLVDGGRRFYKTEYQCKRSIPLLQ